MGPETQCKHVCVILYALTSAAEFRNLYTEVANISSRQKHTGYPVKMEHLKLRPSGSLQRVLDLDPSPADDMPDAEYEDLFRDVIVNMNVPEMSMLQMYPPPRKCPCCCS